MADKQQTAVEWYEQEVSRLDLMMAGGSISFGEYVKLKQEAFVQAKQMEKEQIMKSAQDNFYVGQDLANGHKVDWNSAEEYYNKTYGKDSTE